VWTGNVESLVSRETVLVTGAAGRVARLIAPRLRAEFQLRRLDVAPQEPEGDDDVVQADARDVDTVRQACTDVKAVVHLAAHPAGADFKTILLPRNLDATWAVYEAAVLAGVPRFVFASTVQTVDGSPDDRTISSHDPPRPNSVYGCTKLFGEALGRFHADTSGLGVACLRLGAVRPPDSHDLNTDPRLRRVWLGAGDLGQLIVAAVRSSVPFATMIAVSAPATVRFDTANPFGLDACRNTRRYLISDGS
jgi:uronate dehydrogenase